jgi:hypothetical protein
MLAQGARVPTGRDLARNPRISEALIPIISDAMHQSLLPERLESIVRGALCHAKAGSGVAAADSNGGGPAAQGAHDQRAGKRARLSER